MQTTTAHQGLLDSLQTQSGYWWPTERKGSETRKGRIQSLKNNDVVNKYDGNLQGTTRAQQPQDMQPWPVCQREQHRSRQRNAHIQQRQQQRRRRAAMATAPLPARSSAPGTPHTRTHTRHDHAGKMLGKILSVVLLRGTTRCHFTWACVAARRVAGREGDSGGGGRVRVCVCGTLLHRLPRVPTRTGA